MGEYQKKVTAFLASHPFCCFCGGEEPATTIDHQPARSLFDQRQWPEGYIFPACHSCNQESRRHEHVLAVLVRISVENDNYTGLRRDELQKYIRAMQNNFPDLLRIMKASEKRKFFREQSLKRPYGVSYSDLPMIGVSSVLADAAVTSVLNKLLKALYYKHTETIFPRDGAITYRWVTNAYLHTLSEDGEFISSLGGVPTLRRNGKDLSSQFLYRYGVDMAHLAAGFFIVFRNSLLAIGVAANDERDFLADSLPGDAED
jgi:hypothetical protein